MRIPSFDYLKICQTCDCEYGTRRIKTENQQQQHEFLIIIKQIYKVYRKASAFLLNCSFRGPFFSLFLLFYNLFVTLKCHLQVKSQNNSLIAAKDDFFCCCFGAVVSERNFDFVDLFI